MVVDSAVPKQQLTRLAENSSGDIEELIRPAALELHLRGNRGGFERWGDRRGGFGYLGRWRRGRGWRQRRGARCGRAPAD